MKKKSWLLVILLVLAIALMFTGCSRGGRGSGGDGPIVFRMGHTLAVTSHYHMGCERLAALVNERSNGAIRIDAFGGSVLGGERDMVEGMQMGTVDMALSTTAPVGAFLPEMKIFDLPFLFRDLNHSWAVADGEIGENILRRLETIRIVGFAYWENGLRHIYSNFPIRTPADLTGTKIRVMQNDVHMRSFEAMGALSTPMAFSELFTALQQGTVDGAENSITVVYTDRFFEASNTLSLTAHFASVVPVLMSQIVYNRQTPEHQALIRNTAIEVREWQRNLTLDNEARFISSLRDAGMTIIEPSQINRASFEAVTHPIYREFYDQIPENLITAVLNM